LAHWWFPFFAIPSVDGVLVLIFSQNQVMLLFSSKLMGVWDFYAPLGAGGGLVLPPPDGLFAALQYPCCFSVPSLSALGPLFLLPSLFAAAVGHTFS